MELKVGRRRPILMPLGERVRRIGDHLLIEQVHEQEQRFGLEHQKDRLVVGVVVEVLMHAAVLDEHHIAGLPLDAAPVMDVMAASLDDVEAGRVQMPMLLAIGARGISLDMRFDRLRDLRGGARRDDMLAIEVRPALPGHALGRDDTRLVQELFGQMAVGAFERADEGALLLPALPDDGLLLIVLGPGDRLFGGGFGGGFGHADFLLAMRNGGVFKLAPGLKGVKLCAYCTKKRNYVDFCTEAGLMGIAKPRIRPMKTIAFSSHPNVVGTGQANALPHIPAEEALTKVVSNVWVNDEYKHLVITAGEKALAAKPGQFFNILCPSPDDGELWLRRPQSVYRIDREGRRIEFLYKCVGRGTKGMATFEAEDTCNIVGPLGVGFFLTSEVKHIVVLGRGV